ncbi:MAG: RluA family pseudouridine synthase, partial [Gammaproteobacteria bacterium]
MLNDAVHHEHHALEVPPGLDGLRLDQALAQLLPQYSRSALKQWIEAGQATLNAAPARPRSRVHAGDALAVTATLAPDEALVPQAVGFRIAHEDAACIVVDKPAGVVVHPGAGNRDHTLVNGLLARYPELAVLPRAGLVHRIDKDTSGLLLVARTPATYQALVRAMAARDIARTYHAVVTGVPVAGGTIDAAIARDPNQRTRMRVSEGGRTAVTHYRVLARYRAHALLEVNLETGRTHQIRVH